MIHIPTILLSPSISSSLLLLLLLLLLQSTKPRYLDHFYTRLAYNPTPFTSRLLDHYTAAFSQAGAMRSGMDLYRAFHDDVTENKAHLAENGRSNVPCCAFSGAQSLLAGYAKSQTDEMYGNVQVVTVERSGHWVAEENPEGCCMAILEFVKKHKGK